MNPTQAVPEAVQITMKAFETLIQLDERRRRELVLEVSNFGLEYRLSDLPEATRRIVARLLEPRVAEIQSLDRRISLVRDKLEDLRVRWAYPEGEADTAAAADPDAQSSESSSLSVQA